MYFLREQLLRCIFRDSRFLKLFFENVLFEFFKKIVFEKKTFLKKANLKIFFKEEILINT